MPFFDKREIKENRTSSLAEDARDSSCGSASKVKCDMCEKNNFMAYSKEA